MANIQYHSPKLNAEIRVDQTNPKAIYATFQEAPIDKRHLAQMQEQFEATLEFLKHEVMCTDSPEPATQEQNVSFCRTILFPILRSVQLALKDENLNEAAAHITHMQLLIYEEWKNREALLHDAKIPESEQDL